MNSSSPVATGAAAVTGAMLGGVIVWLCSACHVSPPPSDVAGTIGAVVLVAAHSAVVWLNRRFPAPVADPAKSVPAPVPAAV